MMAKVMPGEKNPRRNIIIQIGTGNRFCTNCKYLGTHLHLNTDDHYCRIFSDPIKSGSVVDLKENARFGPERADVCRAAEKLIQGIKDISRKEGENDAYRKQIGG